MRRKYIAVLILLCVAAAAANLHKDLFLPPTKGLQSFPVEVGTWRMAVNTVFSAPVLKVLRPSDYVMRSYADPQGRQIGMYVGYHDGGKDAGPIHSPRNCLPGSGWHALNSKEMTVAAGGDTVRMVRTVYAKEREEVIFYYWYQIRGQSLTSDWGMKLTELKNALFYQRKDAAFIRLDISNELGGQADALVTDFIRGAYPALKEYLPS